MIVLVVVMGGNLEVGDGLLFRFPTVVAWSNWVPVTCFMSSILVVAS